MKNANMSAQAKSIARQRDASIKNLNTIVKENERKNKDIVSVM